MMKHRTGGDAIAVAAILSGAALSAGLTAGFFGAATSGPVVRVEVQKRKSVDAVGIQIPDGYRAVSVSLDDVIARAGWVRPGSHVDVMVSYGDRPEAERSVELVVQNVQVLGNDREISKRADADYAEVVSIVTLLVTPQDAERVAMAAATGTIHLILRNSTDTDLVEVVPAPTKP